MSRLRVRAGWPGLFLACLLGPACVGGLDDAERALFDVGIGDGTDTGTIAGDAGVPPDCPDVVATIFASTEPGGCAQAGCHAAGVFPPDLESADLVSRLTGVESSCNGLLFVDPDNPAESYLVTKTNARPPCGEQMPPARSGGPLADSDIACITQFLNDQLGVGSTPDAGTDDVGPGGDLDAGSPDVPAPVDMGAPPMGNDFEAETMSLTAPFEVQTQAEASNGEFVSQPNGVINNDPDAAEAGRATLEFTLMAGGPTWIFARVRAANQDSDSFWVRVDQEPWIRWNDLNIESAGAWVWDDVHNSDQDPTTPAQYDLAAGPHTLEIAYREANAQLDRIIITQDPDFTPP